MSTVRESVEWLFNDIATYFKFIEFKKNFKIGLSSVAKMYVVCAILRNTITLRPPSLLPCPFAPFPAPSPPSVALRAGVDIFWNHVMGEI